MLQQCCRVVHAVVPCMLARRSLVAVVWHSAPLAWLLGCWLVGGWVVWLGGSAAAGAAAAPHTDAQPASQPQRCSQVSDSAHSPLSDQQPMTKKQQARLNDHREVTKDKAKGCLGKLIVAHNDAVMCAAQSHFPRSMPHCLHTASLCLCALGCVPSLCPATMYCLQPTYYVYH